MLGDHAERVKLARAAVWEAEGLEHVDHLLAQHAAARAEQAAQLARLDAREQQQHAARRRAERRAEARARGGDAVGRVLQQRRLPRGDEHALLGGQPQRGREPLGLAAELGGVGRDGPRVARRGDERLRRRHAERVGEARDARGEDLGGHGCERGLLAHERRDVRAARAEGGRDGVDLARDVCGRGRLRGGRSMAGAAPRDGLSRGRG